MGSVDKEPLDEEGIVKKVKDARTQAKSAQSEWRDEARENYDMVAGKQWATEDEAALHAQGRAAVVFNRLGTVIDAVSGSEVNNRQEVKYYAREVGDAGANEVLTAAAKWVRDNCDAEDEESDAFVDVLVSGIGFTETRMDYEENEEGQCFIERIDPMEVRWDPSARKRNLADARWIQRERGFTKDEIEERWGPQDDLKAQIELDDDQEQLKVEDPVDGYNSGSESAGHKKATYQVIQHQWYELESVYKVLDPTTGQIIDIPEERYEDIAKVAQSQGMPLQSAKIKRRKYLQAFVCGETLLETGPAPCKEDFTIQAITGRRERNTGNWYGLVRPMKDPQRWANKFFSQLLHIINTNAKGGLLMEKGAADNPRKFEKDYAKSDSISWLNPGALAQGKIQNKQPPVIPPAISELMNFSISSIRDTSGVSLELLGMADREQAGYLEAQRTKAGLTILAGFFDALRLYRKRQGRVLAYFIQEYLSDGRLIKIVGPAGEQYVPLLKDPNLVQYDVVVDSAPTARDTKTEAWQAIVAVMPYLERAQIPFPPEALEYAPIPASLGQAWKQQMIQQRQPNPMQQQMEQIGMQQAAADVEKTYAAADQSQATAQLNSVKAQVEAMTLAMQNLQMALGQFFPQPGPGGQPLQQPAPAGFSLPNQAPAPTPFQ